MRPRKVCVCNQISEEEILTSIRNGNDTLQKLMDDTGVSTGCGTCSSAILKILAKELKVSRE
ncbi:(2Fe-2S)-binding protein [Leptospira interrogans]|uniref:Bacterioferritin-associated ferredoxin n=21 Tax=Leptospira interrogans TaxID=173 RepID=Q8EZ41_LEPIN|nr:bacterioferritin-associated ferredoxin [Leptospira interrogans serovar Lai str. 56601]AER03974.1 bacterioferritin-associated ferredoxin [Leptospira interrogans serovar Lai str. IPAV]ALE41260.1 bacterioferritin-associated ferredoxin [Leptospira interrogans serovar Hardjo str. Norma]ARB97690.1 (2Fe-2S)-binding protein [Leptospira interrogans serovar Copenhageni]ASP42952.1 (2Fe-2S)-binding protein [Leptospira interrogans]ASV07699.1 (2Fe-2S)-binding protein [Leptospira interrogans serovar Canic